MIGIKINNTFLDTTNKTKVTLVLNNPLLNEDNLSPGSYTMPFDLPIGERSPKNDEVLEIPDMVENTEGFRKQDASLLFDDVNLKKGTLHFEESEDNHVSSNFIFGVAALEEFKTKKLRAVLNENVQIHSLSFTKHVYLAPGSGAVTPYILNVNGKDYEGATLSDLVNAINLNTQPPLAVATLVGSGSTWLGMAAPYIEIHPGSDPANILSPLHVDAGNQIIDSPYWIGHAHDPSVYDTAYNDFITSTINDSRFRFLQLRNNNPYGEKIKSEWYSEASLTAGQGDLAGGTKSTNFVNAGAGSTIELNDPNFGYGTRRPFNVDNRNSLQPFIRLRHILDKIGEFFNVGYEGDFLNLPEIETICFDNSSILDVPMDFLGKKKFVFWRDSFNMQELVPDLTVRDFFLALQSRYNLGIYYNDRTNNIRMVLRENVAKSILYKDVTTMCSPLKGLKDNRVAGYRMFAEKEPNEAFSALDEKIIDTPEIPLQVNCKSMAGDTDVVRSQAMGSDFGLVVIYDHTITFGPTTFHVARTHGPNWIETLSAVDGIYENFWKYWLFFRQRMRSVKTSIDFDLSEVKDIDWELRARFDRKNYLIKSITVELSNDKMDIGEVIMETF